MMQYAQMRQVKYEAPRWLVETGEVVEAEAVENVNTMVAQGELEEYWSEEVTGYAPYTHIVELYNKCMDHWCCLVVRE